MHVQIQYIWVRFVILVTNVSQVMLLLQLRGHILRRVLVNLSEHI